MLNDRIFILETKRQAVHLCLGLTISVAVYYLTPKIGALVLLPLIIALILLYTVPKKWPDIKIANHFITHFERDDDAKNCPFKGSIWYGIGIIPPLTAAIIGAIPLEVTCAIIAVLSIGDSVSTWIGKFFGKIRIGMKSLEGFVAFLIFSYVGALAYLPHRPEIALLFAAAGAIIEFFTFMDDNFLIPAGLTILYYLLQTLHIII